MPAIQTTYQSNLAPAVAGMKANHEPGRIISRVLSSATAAFGVVVLQGAGDRQVQTVPGNTTTFMGIAMLDDTLRASNANMFVAQDIIPVMLKGVIWVIPAVAVTARQPAFYDSNGNITNVAAGNTAIPGGSFDSSAAAGVLAMLRL